MTIIVNSTMASKQDLVLIRDELREIISRMRVIADTMKKPGMMDMGTFVSIFGKGEFNEILKTFAKWQRTADVELMHWDDTRDMTREERSAFYMLAALAMVKTP